MPVFIGVHKIPAPADENNIQASWVKYKQAAVKRGLRPIRVHYNTQQGVGYCATEAPTANDVQAAHEEIGMPPQEIIEVNTLE